MPILNLTFTERTGDYYQLKDLYHIDRWMCSRCGFILDYQFDDEHVGWPEYDPPPGTVEGVEIDEYGKEHPVYVKPEDITVRCPRCDLDIEATPPIRITVSPLQGLNDVINIIKEGEGRYLEFKRDIPEDAHKLGRVITSFANTSGGKIIVGVDNQGNIKGIPDLGTLEVRDKFQQRMRGIIGNIKPRIEFRIDFFNENNSYVAVITVPKGGSLHLYNEKVYIREAEESRPATSEEIIRLVQEHSAKR